MPPPTTKFGEAIDDDDDDHVAQLLKQDARDRSVKYSALGLQAYLPRRPTTSAPKPNTRFLKNILRDTDSHNAALRRKEEQDARDRMRLLQREVFRSSSSSSSLRRLDEGRERERERKRRSDHTDRGREGYRERDYHRDSKSSRQSREEHDEDDDDEDERRSKKRRRRHDSQSEGSDDYHDGGDHSDYKSASRREHRRSHHRHRDRHHRSGNDDHVDDDNKRRRRHSSESPERSSRREQDRERSHRHRRHRRRHSHRSASRSRSRSRSPDDRKSRRYKRDGTPRMERERDTSSNRRRQLSPVSPPQAPDKETDRNPPEEDSDPLEELVGPLPKNQKHGANMPSIPSKGRGAYRAGAHDIDSHFAADYDPALDVHLDEETGMGNGSSRRPVAGLMTEEDDWDMALEALRDRAHWKQKGAERLRAAGFGDTILEKWNKNPAFTGRATSDRDDGNVEEVKWTKKGEAREWDRGKVLDEDGHYDVKASW